MLLCSAAPYERPFLLAPLGGFAAWIVIAVLAVRGLIQRRPWAWTAAVTLTAASAFLVGVPAMAAWLGRTTLFPLGSPGSILTGGLTSFAATLILIMAGRRGLLAQLRR